MTNDNERAIVYIVDDDCDLGASLARMETRIALEEFHRRWPVYETPDDGVVRMHSSNVRGLSGLRVEVG